MNLTKKSAGIALAVTAASMLAACNTNSTKSGSAVASNVHCYGVNKCAGHNDCKTASNACKGQASCKGAGFVSLSAKACDDVGGTAGA